MNPSKPEASALTLALDTSGETLMLALWEDDQCLSDYQQPESLPHQQHSAVIFPALAALFSDAGKTFEQLKTLVVNMGPGRFTGIRTGITIARTLGQFLPLSIYAFNTFECAALSAPNQPVTLLLDALRGKVFAAQLIYQADSASFDYQLSPQLMQLDDSACQALIQTAPAGSFLVSRSLSDISGLESAQVFDPKESFHAMAKIVCGNAQKPDSHRIPWQDLRPLYLQEPNITLRKSAPGRLA